MFTVSTHITRKFSPVVAAGAVLAALALPSSAAATPDATFAVSVVEGHLSIDSLSSTTAMHVRVLRTDENTIRVSDLQGATAQTGDHCLVVQDDDTVDCDITGLTVEHVQFEGSPLADSLYFYAGWALPVLAWGWGGADTIAGGNASDSLHGGNGADTLRGGAGNDYIFGESGNDVLAGGAGNDRVSGDAGADRIFGNAGRDILRGGTGADRLFAKGDAAGRADSVNGGSGFDRASLDRHVDAARQVERISY
jgi:Ca2+-binding RTX toxin-like protein